MLSGAPLRALQGGLGSQGIECMTDPPCRETGPCPSDTSFACSQASWDFLRVNVLDNDDIKIIIYSGMVAPFDGKARTPGVHVIPLSEQVPRVPNSNAKSAALSVPDGQVLIVTDYAAFAVQEDVGLPGGHVLADPALLCGNMTFFLLQANGQQAMPRRAILTSSITGERRFARGTSLLDEGSSRGLSPPLTFTSKTWIQACYEVFIPPYRGIVEAIGIQVRGYMINQQLLSEIQSRPNRTGG